MLGVLANLSLRGRSCENWDVLLGHLGPGGPGCILRSLRPYGDFWGHLSPKFSLATYSSLPFGIQLSGERHDNTSLDR